MSQLNNNNFFRWYAGNVIDEQSITLPRLGVQDAKSYLPQLVSGEQTGFYINSDIPFYDADQLGDLQLRLTDGTVIGTILQSVVLQLGYRLYAAFTVPVLAQGQYQYEIYNTSTLTIKCISNYFQIIDLATADLYTCSVKWRNSRDAFFYDWSVVPDFYCQLRLNLSLSNYQDEGTVDQTKAVSTGLRRNNNYDLDFSVKLQTYYFDDGANRGCTPLFTASDIQINGRSYINKTLYIPNVRIISKVNIGEIELYDQAFSKVNKYGQLPQLVLKTGKYVLINNTNSAFTVQKFSSANASLGNIVVPTGTTLAIDINDLQINSYLNIVAGTEAAYQALTAHTLPDGTFQYVVNEITTTDPGNQVTQNQIYGNDWFVTLGELDVPVVHHAIVNMNVSEQAVPFIDANGQLYVNGDIKFTINITGSDTATVDVGDDLTGIAFTEEASSASAPILHMAITKTIASVTTTIYDSNTPAVPGANLTDNFATTAEADAVYDIEIDTSGV